MTRILIKRNVFNLIFLFFSVLMFGQNYRLEDFKIDSIPTRENLWKANHSNENWVIERIKDSINIYKNNHNYFKGDSLPFSQKHIAKKLKIPHSIRAVKKVNDGYLIGANGGEFGGGIWFLSTNGKSAYEIARYFRVHDIFEFNDKIYVIRGLAHLGSSYGSLFEISKDKKWHVSKAYQLPDAPSFIIKEKENILIFTSEHLISFNDNERLIKVLKAPFYWGMLYPSSAIIVDNDLYIAMRKGILKISHFKYNPKYKWYVKK